MIQEFLSFAQENIKLMIFLGSGVFFYSLESFFPFKEHLESRWTHIGRNLLMATVNFIGYGIVFGIAVGWVLNTTLINHFGLFQWLELGFWTEIFWTVLLLDLIIYFWHIILHKIPLLWRFHLVHHVDSRLDFSSGTRFHLGEMIASMIFHLPIYFLLGVSIEALLVSQLLLIFFIQYTHGNFILPQWLDDKMRLVFITPNIHQVHHSNISKEYNSNYGTVFSFWDYFGKTFNHQKDLQNMTTGVKGFAKNPSFWKIMKLPFSLKLGKERDH